MHTSNCYMNESYSMYVKELAAKLPPGFDSIYLVASGSEANDMAVMLAKLYTGHESFICLRNAYHGMVGFSYHITSLSTWKHNLPPMSGLERALMPDTYRG